MRALAEIRCQTYWAIGQRLEKAIASTPDKTTASQLVKKLAPDLHIHHTNLYRALQFYHSYPNALPDSPETRRLPWSVHTQLLPIKNPEKRAFYLQRAIDSGWTARVLRRAIRSRLFENEQKQTSPAALDRPATRVFNYAATIERVIDGDTLIVKIDLGFRTFREETIRLRGIDAPEIRTPAGKKAKAFISKALSGLKQVVIRTYKTDVYGRYVGDLFYDPVLDQKDQIFEQGKFLNQELLTRDLASPGFWD